MSDSNTKRRVILESDSESDDEQEIPKATPASPSPTDEPTTTPEPRKPVTTLLSDDEEEEDEDDEDKSPAASKKDRKDDDEDESDSNKEDEVSNDEPKQPTKKSKKAERRRSLSSDEEDEEPSDSSDSEEEQESKKKSKKKTKEAAKQKDKDDDEGEDEDEVEGDVESESDRELSQPAPIYDFDIMMAKKKEENSKKRKKRNYDIINDNDDIIADIINQMRDAVEADVEANKNRMAATNKLKLLPFVMSQLRKVDLRDAFLDSDVLSTITEWLAPLPDRSLPHLNIRENLLKILIDFNLYDVDRIKGSGIGKAVMYLYKHPKESKENKQRAKQLISSWSRPIFNLEASFTAISREEREERDLELMKRQRRVSQQETSDSDAPGPSSAQKKTSKDTEPVAQKPGEKGWIPRARVPAPSMRDYVIRPHSKVEGDISRNSKRPTNTLERMMKVQQERKRASKQQRAVKMNIDRGL